MLALALLLLLLGFVGWITGFTASAWLEEMPLGQLEGIAVDSDGNIYCASQFYNRVQKYSPEGRFLFGLTINTSGGSYRIRINNDDELEIATARNDSFYRFSSDGKLLETKKNVDHFYGEFGSLGQKKCRGPNNSKYEIKWGTLFPQVIEVASSGEQRTVVSTPLHKWFVMGPQPAWLFIMASMGLLFLLYKLTFPITHKPQNPL